jgi:hypothetical protein
MAKNIEAAEAASPGKFVGFESEYYKAAEWIQDLVDMKHGSRDAETLKGNLGDSIKGALEGVKALQAEDPEGFNQLAKSAEDISVISPEGDLMRGSYQAIDMSEFAGRDNVFDAVKGHIVDRMEPATGLGDFDKGFAAQKAENKDLIDLYNWKETGKWSETASEKIKNLVDNYEELGKGGKDLGDLGKAAKSDRLEMMKKYMDLGRSKKITIPGPKGALQL